MSEMTAVRKSDAGKWIGHGGRCLIAFLLFCGGLPAVGCAAEEMEAVSITADSVVHESVNETIKANGNVRIDWQGYSLLADEVDYGEKDDIARASGRVRLLKGDDVLSCDSLRLNLATQQGEAENGRLRTKDGNLRIKGGQFEKYGPEQYRLKRGSFTTCDGEPPSWEFTASDLDVTLEGYATGRNAVFSVAGLPLFYTPYILFPVKRERQSGFLFPRFGSSTKKGILLDVPYYWAISPSIETTVDLDLQTKRGAGLGVDSAYLERGGSHGALKLYSIYDTNLQRERATVNTTIKHIATPTVEFNADLSAATDRTFFKDYGEASGDYNRQLLDSSLSLTKRADDWYLAGEARILNDLEGPANEFTLQRLPELTLIGTGRRLGSLPLYAGIESRFTNFFRREGLNGERFLLQPTLTWYADLPEGLALSAWGGYQERLYQAYGGPGDGTQGVGLALAGAGGKATFARLYDTGPGELTRLRHVIEPGLAYSFVEEKDQGRAPFFDFDDRPVGQSLLTWSVASSLTGRFEPASSVEYREILSLKLSQGYQLRGGRRDLLNGADSGRPLTDVRLEAKARPLRALTIEADTRFSPYRAEVTTAAVSADLHDEQGNSATFGYRRIADTVNYLEGKLSVNLVKPFVFNYTSRYSIDGRDFLESYYALEYRHQCWSITFTYRDRPDNREFVLSFNLAGIGNIGKVKTF